MIEDIELPPLPKYTLLRGLHTSENMQDYARAAIKADRQHTADLLKNPAHVHTNMCRGIIAPITFDQLAHVLGEAATDAWLADRQLRGEPVASSFNDDDLERLFPQFRSGFSIKTSAVVSRSEIHDAIKSLALTLQPAAPAQEPVDPPGDNFGSAEHWKEKAQHWAAEAHKARQQALRGEPADGIVPPSTPAQEPSVPEQGFFRLLVAACNRLSAAAEEYELDDGMGRAADLDYWHAFDDALEAACNYLSSTLPATPQRAGPAQLAWRVVDGKTGLPQTDWIDGSGGTPGADPAFPGGVIQRAWGSPPQVRQVAAWWKSFNGEISVVPAGTFLTADATDAGWTPLGFIDAAPQPLSESDIPAEPVGAPSGVGSPGTLEMYLNPRPVSGGHPVYLYRRKGMGMTYFMSTTKEQYDAYSERPDLIETITLYTAPQPAASTDSCTDPDNCRRCQTIPEHRGDMQHAGIGSYPSAQEPSVPEGWKLVPAQPTVEMSTAAKEESKRWSTRGGEDETLHYCTYVAMLKAAPTPPADKE